MSGYTATWVLVVASCLTSLFIGGEAGLFLALAALALALYLIVNEPSALQRRAARKRNQAHRR